MTKAEKTRHEILKQSSFVIYRNGYQSSSLDDILAPLDMTKGAFFYHFKNKEEMCLSMIKEIYHAGINRLWIHPLRDSKDPFTDIIKLLTDILSDEESFDVRYGCPACNLIQEMSGHSPKIKKELRYLLLDWVSGIEQVLLNGQISGAVNKALNAKEAALFIILGYAGARNMGKIFGTAAYQTYLNQISDYLNRSTI